MVGLIKKHQVRILMRERQEGFNSVGLVGARGRLAADLRRKCRGSNVVGVIKEHQVTILMGESGGFT